MKRAVSIAGSKLDLLHQVLRLPQNDQANTAVGLQTHRVVREPPVILVRRTVIAKETVGSPTKLLADLKRERKLKKVRRERST